MTDETVKTIETASDVTPEILKAAEQCFDAWFDNDQPIDWESFLDRLADPHGHAGAGRFDFDEYDNPAIRKIQRHIREYRKEG